MHFYQIWLCIKLISFIILFMAYYRYIFLSVSVIFCELCNEVFTIIFIKIKIVINLKFIYDIFWRKLIKFAIIIFFLFIF